MTVTIRWSLQDSHGSRRPVKKENNIMYRENFKTELPQFSDRQVLISELGAVSGTFSDEAGRQNAKVINHAIRELSEHGGGTLVIPAGIWASAPIRLLSHVRLHLESQALLKFTKTREDYPLVITNYEGQECIRAISPIMAEGAENIAITGDGIIDGRQFLVRETDIHYRTHDLDHFPHMTSGLGGKFGHCRVNCILIFFRHDGASLISKLLHHRQFR